MNDLIYLSEICEQCFGLSERIAQRKAALGLLPIPAFRLSGTRKGPLYVRQSDLDALLRLIPIHHPALERRRKSGLDVPVGWLVAADDYLPGLGVKVSYQNVEKPPPYPTGAENEIRFLAMLRACQKSRERPA